MTKKYKYIDAVRGYAILLVIAVHTSQASPAWNGIARKLVDQGARGVQLFFVASALTLMLSWHSRSDGMAAFYIRRLFRIAPMFWLAMVFFVWLNDFSPTYFAPNGTSWSDVFLTALFLNGWHPELITSVVDGGWSVVVEITFYVLFPLLAVLIRGWISAVLVLILTIYLSDLTLQYFWLGRNVFWPGQPDYLVSTFLNLWFPSQLPVFVFGFLLYYLQRDFQGKLNPSWNTAILLLSFGGAVYFALNPEPMHLLGLVINIQTLFAACFCLFVFALSQGAGRFLVNSVIAHIGKVSFSAYLWHFAVMQIFNLWAVRGLDVLQLRAPGHGFLYFCVFFPVTVGITVLLSSMTYRYVEKNFIALGAKLISKFIHPPAGQRGKVTFE